LLCFDLRIHHVRSSFCIHTNNLHSTFKSGFKTMEDQKSSNCSCIPKFSSYNPVVPKTYTPPWKQDMVNRNLIIENAQLAGNLPCNGTESTLYLENRERLTQVESREVISRRTGKESTRNSSINPPMHSHLSKYRSSLMFRFSDK